MKVFCQISLRYPVPHCLAWQLAVLPSLWLSPVLKAIFDVTMCDNFVVATVIILGMLSLQ